MGHALHNDLKVQTDLILSMLEWLLKSKKQQHNIDFRQVLLLSHPKEDIRDTSQYELFHK